MTRSKSVKAKERTIKRNKERLTIEMDHYDYDDEKVNDEYVDDEHRLRERSPDNLHERCRFYGAASPALCHRRWWACVYSPDYYYDTQLGTKEMWDMYKRFHKWLDYTRECRVRDRLRVYEEELIAKSCAPHRLEQL
jgi:hypothetical protein